MRIAVAFLLKLSMAKSKPLHVDSLRLEKQWASFREIK